jgi:nicotinic acid phosphoribosyltransferase
MLKLLEQLTSKLNISRDDGEAMREPDEVYCILATDFYELTMAKGYMDSQMENKMATFDLFIRSLPENWGYLIANGIEDAIDFLSEDFFSKVSIFLTSEIRCFRSNSWICLKI